MKTWMKALCLGVVLALSPMTAFAAISIPFTVNLSEAVTVNTGGGTPRIAVDVGGVTRYATYTSGTGTSALTFTYAMVAGDVDLDGVTVSSPIDLNGGTIKDLSGNDLSPLTFTPPNTTNVKVNFPSLGMDFVADADGRYTLNGTPYNDLTSFLTAIGGTFSRNSIGTYYDASGVLQTAASGVPRFDYDPVTNAAKGILIEESRTNFLARSNQVEFWAANGTTSVNANSSLAPDGSMNADTISSTGGGSGYYIFGATVLGQTYTQSGYLKDLGSSSNSAYFGNDQGGSRFVLFNPQTMTITYQGPNILSSSIVNVGAGWYRISVTWQPTGTASPLIIYNDSSSPMNIAVWGVQLEQGAFPTSYIPTTAGTATRAADVMNIPTGAWYGTTAHTAMTKSIASPGNNSVGIILEGNNAKGLTHSYGNSSSYELSARNINGTNSLIAGLSINTPGTANIFALTYDTNLPSFAINNTLVSGNYSAATLGSPSSFYIGSRDGSSLFLNGWTSKVKYYPSRVTDTQLQLLTQ